MNKNITLIRSTNSKTAQIILPLIVPYTVFIFVNLFFISGQFIVSHNFADWLINLFFLLDIVIGFFLFYFFINVVYFPIVVTSYYLKIAKKSGSDHPIASMLGYSYLCLTLFYVPATLVFTSFCPGSTCDTAEPASFAAVLVFAYLLNLVLIGLVALYELLKRLFISAWHRFQGRR